MHSTYVRLVEHMTDSVRCNDIGINHRNHNNIIWLIIVWMLTIEVHAFFFLSFFLHFSRMKMKNWKEFWKENRQRRCHSLTRQMIIIFWNIFSINLFISQSTNRCNDKYGVLLLLLWVFSFFTLIWNVENVTIDQSYVLCCVLNSWKVRWWFILIFLFFVCLGSGLVTLTIILEQFHSDVFLFNGCSSFKRGKVIFFFS